LFSLNDAMGKWMVATYSVGQVLLIRSIAALVLLSPFVFTANWRSLFQVDRPWLQLLRVVCATAEVFCFYWAVYYLPLADVMTYWLAAPIIMAVLAPMLLGEKIVPLQWVAIGVGFVGVLIALTPSGEFQLLPMVIAIAGTLAFVLMVMTGRSLRGTPATTLVLFQTVGAFVAGAVLVPFDWTTPTTLDYAFLCALGAVAMFAHILMNYAVKFADASVVAPMQYTMLIWAVVFGWLFFGDLPRLTMSVGIVFIIASGVILYVSDRNRKE